MKISFLKKLFAFLALGTSVLALGACQSTSRSEAKILIEESSCSFYTEEQTGKYYVKTVIGVRNNTIYDVRSWNMVVETTDAEGVKTVHPAFVEDMYIRHGNSGYVVSVYEQKDTNIKSARLVEASAHEFANLWDSYMAWWIAGIIFISITWIFYACTIFSEKMDVEEAKRHMVDNIGNTVLIFSLFLIISIFPIFFGSWVSALILVGTLIASILGVMAMTGIKTAFSKKA